MVARRLLPLSMAVMAPAAVDGRGSRLGPLSLPMAARILQPAADGIRYHVDGRWPIIAPLLSLAVMVPAALMAAAACMLGDGAPCRPSDARVNRLPTSPQIHPAP